MKFKNIKKYISFAIAELINEHSKLLLIVILSLVVFLGVYLYVSPPSQDLWQAPIQFLPKQICAWRGTDVPIGISFKNNQYKSAKYFDPATGIEIHFISYQRRNEKYNQIHYPEDCLRSVGIFNFKEKTIPINIDGKIINFKRLYGQDKSRIIIHYYVILTRTGENFFYTGQDTSLFKLLIRKYSIRRVQEQIFRFTCELRPNDNKINIADSKLIEFIQTVPLEFWPK